MSLWCGPVVVVLWLTLLALAALALRRRWPEQREWSRKLVHIGTGAVLPLAWAWGIERWIAVPAAAAVTLAALLNHRLQLLPAIEDVGRPSYGTVAYGGAITVLLFLYWPGSPQVATAAVLVMALGDGLAGLVGARFSSPRWQVWGQTKSMLGTLTMGLVSLLVLLLMLLISASLGLPAPPLAALPVLALFAAALEQVAFLGLDNLTVPLGVALMWQWLAVIPG
ncbi:MAG: diacylglycerol/polyprenol kinase family protein [Cyanobacteriota bacterium]